MHESGETGIFASVLSQLVRIAEGRKHNRGSRGKRRFHLKGQLARRGSSERLNDLMVRVRSLLAISAAAGFISRIKPKSRPSAT